MPKSGWGANTVYRKLTSNLSIEPGVWRWPAPDDIRDFVLHPGFTTVKIQTVCRRNCPAKRFAAADLQIVHAECLLALGVEFMAFDHGCSDNLGGSDWGRCLEEVATQRTPRSDELTQ